MKTRILSMALITVILLGMLCSCDLFGGSKFEFTETGDSYELTSRGTDTATEVIVPDTYKKKPVTSIGNSAFAKAWFGAEETPNIVSVTLPEGITSIGIEAFAGQSSLTSINIPSTVTSIGRYAFYNCSSLTSIVIPEGVTEIKEGTFYGCSRLTSVTIPSTVTKIEASAFEGCSYLTSIVLPDGVTEISAHCFKDCRALTSFPITNNVTTIGKNAYDNCDAVTSFTMPASVTTIESSAFNSTAEALVINVSFDSEAPEGWDQYWMSGIKGKVINTSETYYNTVVAANQERAEELESLIAGCDAQYESLQAQYSSINDSYRWAQQYGSSETIREYNRQLRENREQQSEVLNTRRGYKDELDGLNLTNQLNKSSNS